MKNISNITAPTSKELKAMLTSGHAPSLAMLLALCPDEPLVELDPIVRRSFTDAEYQCWKTDVLERRLKYPGYQACPRYREHMKYGHPFSNATPLSERIAVLLNHAKSKWSMLISNNWIQVQFKDWLPNYPDSVYCWNDPDLQEPLQLLRMACGLSRYRSNK